MILPKWATTVTPFSKTLALIIFVTFPIFGFILGMNINTTNNKSNRIDINNNRSINPKLTRPTPIPIISLAIHEWYLMAESTNFKIYYSGLTDGSITTVVDKNTSDLYIPPPSCEIEIPEKDLNENDFYNKTIGIIKHGPHKNISNESSEIDTFRQRFSSGGRYAEEGTIKLRIIKAPFGDTEKLQIECKIKINFKDLEHY